jgi:hypothetical protein
VCLRAKSTEQHKKTATIGPPHRVENRSFFWFLSSSLLFGVCLVGSIFRQMKKERTHTHTHTHTHGTSIDHCVFVAFFSAAAAAEDDDTAAGGQPVAAVFVAFLPFFGRCKKIK